MKKTLKILTIVAFILFAFLSLKVDAATLDTLNITLNKETIHPDEEVTLTVDFGQTLGSYDFEFAYDNNLLDFVSVEGGTANDTGDKVIVSFYDPTGGTTPRDNMTIVFRANSNITTSNPTDIAITASGMANADASETYDDISVPIIKDLIVEPLYENYTIALNYDGSFIANEPKDMNIIISSAMGKNYDHVRLLATVTTPEDGIVKMLATDDQALEHDIIQSGWGPAEGYQLGGTNITQTIKTSTTFSKEGRYDITLSLVDRDNSDNIIASSHFLIDVSNASSNPGISNPENPDGVVPPEAETPDTNVPEETPSTETPSTEKVPETLPKTGVNMYLVCIIAILAFSIATYIVYKKK